MREIHYIIVHCTDSPDNMDIGVKEIDEWHKLRGWREIGYHSVVRRDGLAEVGQRHEEEEGAHAHGLNAHSLGIVWVGRHDCNEKQHNTLVQEIVEWMIIYKIHIANVLGHCEIPNVSKTCPNINMNKLRNDCERLYNQIMEV